jgi:hypothetical protein
MFTVELYAKIRYAVMIDGLSRREAAKRFGVHRNTITKMLIFSVPPGFRPRQLPGRESRAKAVAICRATPARICRPMTEPFIKAFVYAAEQYSSQALDFGDAQMRRLFLCRFSPWWDRER